MKISVSRSQTHISGYSESGEITQFIKIYRSDLAEIEVMRCKNSNLGSILGCSISQVSIKNLPPHHSDVLMRLQRPPNVDGHIRRRDHLHLRHSPIDDVKRQVELTHHAKRNCAAAWLGVIELPFEKERLDTSLSESLCGGSSSRSTADDSHSEVPVADLGAGRGGDYDIALLRGYVEDLGVAVGG